MSAAHAEVRVEYGLRIDAPARLAGVAPLTWTDFADARAWGEEMRRADGAEYTVLRRTVTVSEWQETTRQWTPDRRNPDGSTTVTVKRCCNGCGRPLGDVTDREVNAGIAGIRLPDVRDECGCLTRVSVPA